MSLVASLPLSLALLITQPSLEAAKARPIPERATTACPSVVENCVSAPYATLEERAIHKSAITEDWSRLLEAAASQARGVRLSFCVDARGGKATEVRVELPSSFAGSRLSKSLREYIERWRFEPLEHQGEPTLTCTTQVWRTPAAMAHVVEDPRTLGTAGPAYEAPVDYVMAQPIYRAFDAEALSGSRTARLGAQPRLRAGVRFCVERNGRITDIRTIYKARGDPGIDRVIRTIVSKWRYRPAIVNGRPVRTCWHRYRFRLLFAPRGSARVGGYYQNGWARPNRL